MKNEHKKTYKILWCLLTAIIFLAAAPHIGDDIELSAFLNARNTANFLKTTKNINYTLSKGTQGKIQAVKKFASGRYGLRINISNGPHKNETAWVYYNPQQPSLKILGKEEASPKQGKAVEAKRDIAAVPEQPKKSAPAEEEAVSELQEPLQMLDALNKLQGLTEQEKDCINELRAAGTCKWSGDNSALQQIDVSSQIKLFAMAKKSIDPTSATKLEEFLMSEYTPATAGKITKADFQKKYLAQLQIILNSAGIKEALQKLNQEVALQKGLVEKNAIDFIASENSPEEVAGMAAQAQEAYSKFSEILKSNGVSNKETADNFFKILYGSTFFLQATNLELMKKVSLVGLKSVGPEEIKLQKSAKELHDSLIPLITDSKERDAYQTVLKNLLEGKLNLSPQNMAEIAAKFSQPEVKKKVGEVVQVFTALMASSKNAPNEIAKSAVMQKKNGLLLLNGDLMTAVKKELLGQCQH